MFGRGRRFDRRLEGAVGDALARIFGGNVVALEAGQALVRGAEDGVIELPGGRTLAPNRFTLLLGPDDFERTADDAVLEALRAYLVEQIADRGWDTYGDVILILEHSDALRTGQHRVHASVDPDAAPVVALPVGLAVLLVSASISGYHQLVDMFEADGRVGSVESVTGAAEAIRALSRQSTHRFDVVVVDTRELGPSDHRRVLDAAAKWSPPQPVVIMRAVQDLARVVSGYDDVIYLLLPPTQGKVSAVLDRFDEVPEYVPPPPAAPSSSGKAFLCHSSDDRVRVRALYDRLVAAGFDCWLDKVDLRGGQDWDREIRKAIERSDFVLACLSAASITKRGYIQRELRVAYEVALEQPDGAVFLIPVRLEPCELPDKLRHLHWVDLFEPDGFDRLVRSMAPPPN